MRSKGKRLTRRPAAIGKRGKAGAKKASRRVVRRLGPVERAVLREIMW